MAANNSGVNVMGAHIGTLCWGLIELACYHFWSFWGLFWCSATFLFSGFLFIILGLAVLAIAPKKD